MVFPFSLHFQVWRSFMVLFWKSKLELFWLTQRTSSTAATEPAAVGVISVEGRRINTEKKKACSQWRGCFVTLLLKTEKMTWKRIYPTDPITRSHTPTHAMWRLLWGFHSKLKQEENKLVVHFFYSWQQTVIYSREELVATPMARPYLLFELRLPSQSQTHASLKQADKYDLSILRSTSMYSYTTTNLLPKYWSM